jgi:hypothetical protein
MASIFKPVCEVGRDDLGAAAFERPVILPPDSGWRLYLSCAAPAISGPSGIR